MQLLSYTLLILLSAGLLIIACEIVCAVYFRHKFSYHQRFLSTLNQDEKDTTHHDQANQ